MAAIRAGNGCRSASLPDRTWASGRPVRAEGFRGPVQFLKIAGFATPRGKVRAVTLRTPYLLFIGDAADQLAAKTAAGIAFSRPDISLGQFRLPGCNADLGLPDMTIEWAVAAGGKTRIIGTTNRGRRL